MAESSRMKNSMLNILSSFAMQLVVIVLNFVTRTVFIHTLGKAYLGISGLFVDILTMLSLSELGFDTAINFKLYKPIAEKDEKRIRILMKFYRQAYVAVGAVIFLLGLCVIPLLPLVIRDYETLAGLGINAPLIFMLYLMQSVSSYLFFAYKSAIVKADQKTYLLNVAGCAVALASNLAQILVLLLSRSFVLYTATLVVFSILQNAVNGWIAQRCYPGVFIREKESLSREEVRDLFKDCGALFIYKVNGVVLKATDNMVLSTFIGLAIVGMYSNYLLFYSAIKSILQKFYDAVKASMGNLFTTADMAKRYHFFEVMNYITVILYGTAAVGVAAVGDELIRQWIGSDYVIAQPFAILVGYEILCVGLRNNLAQVRSVTGVFRQMWLRPVMGIVINLAVSIGLVQTCGIYGVLIGTIASDCLTYFLVDPVIIHRISFEGFHSPARYYRKNVLYVLLLTAVGALDIWLCRRVLTGFGWLSVGAHIVLCAVSVPAVFLALYWKTGECRYLISLAKRLAGKILKKRR